MTLNPLEPTSLGWNRLFASEHNNADPYLAIDKWDFPVMYFVGRNGTGKSRAGKALAAEVEGLYLGADRLTGLMRFNTYGFGSVPDNYRGVPLSEADLTTMQQVAGKDTSPEIMYLLRDNPATWLRVAAFIRRAFGRTVELREVGGFLDPYVRVGNADYSLLRDEGHGLRELVLLLAATYRDDWRLLVIDEPELHLHPSLARLWLSELERACAGTDRHAVVITHQPGLVNPVDAEHLGAIWMFAQGRSPRRLSDAVLPVQASRVTASMQQNPALVSQMVFSPRPVLVEGVTDVAALSTALTRLLPVEVVAQTDLIECGGSGGVALWFEVCRNLGVDVRAIADLDAALAPEVQRAMDALPEVAKAYQEQLVAETARTNSVLQPLIRAADKAGVANDPAQRADWLATVDLGDGGLAVRLSKVLEIWRDAGLWLHPQGTLEKVLGIAQKDVVPARRAAMLSGSIDAPAVWCAFSLSMESDVAQLLSQTVERIAHEIMEALRLDPGLTVVAPMGSNAQADSRLVDVAPTSAPGVHRITVKALSPFSGYWLEFSRTTPATELVLAPPETD